MIIAILLGLAYATAILGFKPRPVDAATPVRLDPVITSTHIYEELV